MTGPKHTVYTRLAEVAQAAGHPNRLEILEHLAQGPRTVDELAAIAGLTFANTSRHLQILRRARLVDVERLGRQMRYSLAGETEVVSLLKALGSIGERNIAEIRQVMADYFQARDVLAPVSREELARKLRGDMITLLDVRPEDEFNLGHLPGALCVPLEDLDKHLSELPKDQEIVAYCRGPYCILSFEAVAKLRERGYKVRRLEDGYPEWKAAGLQVEAAS